MDAELMADIGREMERMEDLIHDLRAENKLLRGALQKCHDQSDEMKDGFSAIERVWNICYEALK